jgi:protein kinase-like protein
MLMPGQDLSGRTLGEFVLCERIGEGDLYRGEQRFLERDVVVRVLHQQPDDVALQRFRKEAKLKHSNAAHVLSFGVCEETGVFWVATELVHGVTLDQWLATHGPMSPDQFVPFFECVAHVVKDAHDHGIVHRALKPSKVMVLGSAGRPSPKILGFALDQLTSGDGMGSQAADIHALGVIAYELLTGVPVNSDAQVPPLGGDFSPDLDGSYSVRSPGVRRIDMVPRWSWHRSCAQRCAGVRASSSDPRRSSGTTGGGHLDCCWDLKSLQTLPRRGSANLCARSSQRASDARGGSGGSGCHS